MTLPIIPVAMLGKRGTRSFPTLRSTSNHTVGIGTSQNVNLPSGIQSGDLVVLGISARTTVLGLSAINVPSGWTSLAYDTSEVTSFCRLIYIIATGSMSTVTIETPGASTSLTTNGYCFSVYTLVPISTAYATGTGANPNSPSLSTPAEWGANVHKLCISMMHLMGDVTASAIPSGYGNQLSSLSSNNNRTYSARREIRSSDAEDPGAWTITGTNPSLQRWRALTLAVRGK